MIALVKQPHPQDNSAPRVVERAICATGGRESLAAYRAITWQEQGRYLGMETQVNYLGDYAVQFPDRYRMRVKGAFTIVVNGDEGWINNCGQVERLTEMQMAEYREASHALWAMQLYPLLEDDRFRIRRLWDHESTAPEMLGVRVSSTGYRDLDLYFDEDLLLLRKSSRVGYSPDFSGGEIVMETEYGDHIRVDGVLLPTKMTMAYDGRRILDSRTGNYRLLPCIDEQLFQPPGASDPQGPKREE